MEKIKKIKNLENFKKMKKKLKNKNRYVIVNLEKFFVESTRRKKVDSIHGEEKKKWKK